MKLKMRIWWLRDMKRRWPWEEEIKGRVRTDSAMGERSMVLEGGIGREMAGSISDKTETGRRRRRRERCSRWGQIRRGGKREAAEAEMAERAT